MKAASDFGTVKIVMLKGEKGEPGSGGDYETLDNKPSIESITLTGDHTFESLNMCKMSNSEIENLLS